MEPKKKVQDVLKDLNIFKNNVDIIVFLKCLGSDIEFFLYNKSALVNHQELLKI